MLILEWTVFFLLWLLPFKKCSYSHFSVMNLCWLGETFLNESNLCLREKMKSNHSFFSTNCFLWTSKKSFIFIFNCECLLLRGRETIVKLQIPSSSHHPRDRAKVCAFQWRHIKWGKREKEKSENIIAMEKGRVTGPDGIPSFLASMKEPSLVGAPTSYFNNSF